MPDRISERDLIERLKRGVARTANLIAHATDYHGGPTTTGPSKQKDIAREFIEADYDTHVEFLIRFFVNGLTALRPGPRLPPLKGKRTDIVLVNTKLIPIALIEVKIGVASLNGICVDLDKITDLFRRLNSTHASKLIGAVVFQAHVGATRSRTTIQLLKTAIERKESRIRSELSDYEKRNPGFSFRMMTLQGRDDGISASDEDNDGHATRYHAVIIRDRRVPKPGKGLAGLKNRNSH